MISTFANGSHHLFCQDFHVHPTAFHILNGSDFVTATVTHNDMIGGNIDTGDAAEAEQIGCFGERSEVCPTLASVATFSVNPDRGENLIHRGGEALAVLDLFDSNNVGKAIDNQRMSISGVDTDEEAVNLVKYQNAYTLASKMIQTLTEVYDRLILETGV